MKDILLHSLKLGFQRFYPFTEWIGELRNPVILRADIMAGITVALVLIPQAMAYAQLAGLPPHYGLYASFLIPMVAAIFGSSRQLHNGPVAIISLMTASALSPYGFSSEQIIAYAALLALMAGAMQLLMGLLRMGVMVDFLSHPVVIGFTNAAAIVIGGLQLGKMFDIPMSRDQPLYMSLWDLITGIGQYGHVPTFVMGASSLIVMVLLKRFAPHLPGILMTAVLATLVSWGIGFENFGGKVVGSVPSGLPTFVWPNFEMKYIEDLLLPAFMIALLSFVEAFSIAKAVASKTRQSLSANQEMVGKGIANLTAGIMQGYPVSGSFSRTAIAFDAGAKTGFSAIVSGIVVGLTLLFFTPILYHLPVATLAAIIISAVASMLTFQPIKHAWLVNPQDGIVAVIVFAVTLYLAPHLEYGIFIGVILSIVFYLMRTMRPHFAELAMDKEGALIDAQLQNLQTSESFAMYRFDGDLYFANAGYLEKRLLNAVAEKPNLKVVVLDIEAVKHIDTTGEEMLAHMADWLSEAGIVLYITRPSFKIRDALIRTGLYAKIGESKIYSVRKDAFTDIKKKYGEQIDMQHIFDYMPIAEH